MTWIAVAVVAILVAVLLVCCAFSEPPGMEEIEPQPCVTDREFCCLLPEVSDEVCMKVRDVLVDVSGWDREEIHPETRLIEFETW